MRCVVIDHREEEQVCNNGTKCHSQTEESRGPCEDTSSKKRKKKRVEEERK